MIWLLLYLSSNKSFYIFSFNMRIFEYYFVFFISMIGTILAVKIDGKWFCYDTQQIKKNDIRNTQIRVFSGSRVIF